MATNLRQLDSDPAYYHKLYNLYNERFMRNEEEWKSIWKENNTMYTFDDSKEDEICILSVGSGEGTRELVILDLALKRYPKVYLRVVEPSESAANIFKEKCAKLQESYPGFHADWHIQTFDEYRKAEDSSKSGEEKFHFVLCLHCLYYVDDIGTAMQFLYQQTKPGGAIAITMIDTKSTVGSLYEKLWNDDNYPISYKSGSQVRMQIKNRGWTSKSRSNWGRLDVTPMIDAPESETGMALLDWFTHSINFRLTASKPMLSEVMSFFETSYEVKDGKKLVSNDREELVITKAITSD